MLSNQHVMLRPPGPDDYPVLRLLETSSPLALRWRLRGSTPSPDDWVQGLWQGVLVQHLVIDHRDGQLVGIACCYDADLGNGFARIAGAKFDPNDRTTRFLEGALLMIGHVFDAWPIRKLYLDVPEYNLGGIESGIGRYLVEEGRLREHRWAAGRWWDELTLALYRSTWEEASGVVSAATGVST